MVATYLTIGPQGKVIVGVNGYAGSIGMHLGNDVLKDANGTLPKPLTKHRCRKVTTTCLMSLPVRQKVLPTISISRR